MKQTIILFNYLPYKLDHANGNNDTIKILYSEWTALERRKKFRIIKGGK